MILFLTYRLTIILLNRFVKKTGGSKSSINAVRVLLRFLVILALIIAIFNIFDVSSTLLLSLSSLFGMVIGFASTEIVTQFIAGIYLMITRPFSVGDLINFGDIEGLVLEINLNRTLIKQFDNSVIQIPNKALLDSQIMNYTIKIPEELKENNQTSENLENGNKISKKNKKASDFGGWSEKLNIMYIMKELAPLLKEKVITQYVFELKFEFDKSPKEIFEKLDEVCQKFENVYYSKPKYDVVNFGFFANIKFWLLALKPQTIMEQQNNLIQNIARAIYSDPEVSKK